MAGLGVRVTSHIHYPLRLKANHPICGYRQLRPDFRVNKAGIFALQICISDPTGRAAAPSDMDGDALGDGFGHQLFQGWPAHPVYRLGHSVFHQIGRLTHQRDLSLMPGFHRPQSSQKGERGPGWVVRPGRSEIKNGRHTVTLPPCFEYLIEYSLIQLSELLLPDHPPSSNPQTLVVRSGIPKW